jgi:hypothetical protein
MARKEEFRIFRGFNSIIAIKSCGIQGAGTLIEIKDSYS